MRDKGIGVAAARAIHLDPAKIGALWSIFPGAAKQVDAMAAVDDATEDFL